MNAQHLLLTGQGGLDRKGFLKSLEERVGSEAISIFHVGDMLYEDADPPVSPGKILAVDIWRLKAIRKNIFERIARELTPTDHVIVSTHVTFRWKRGLFLAFGFEEIQALDPTLLCAVIDDIDAIKLRLKKSEEYVGYEYNLEDLLVWREEEVLATELLAMALRLHEAFYIIPRLHAERLLRQLIFEPFRRKAYLSFPITHVKGDPELEYKIEIYKQKLSDILIAFDPYALKEKRLEAELKAAEDQEVVPDLIEIETLGKTQMIRREEISSVIPGINGQIVSRDFKLIDQSSCVVAYFPKSGTKPIISPGVTRELDYATHVGKDTFVIWESEAAISPWVDDVTSTQFTSIDEAVEYFQEESEKLADKHSQTKEF